jgi:hypothetical protein
MYSIVIGEKTHHTPHDERKRKMHKIDEKYNDVHA